ncbi:MAG: hypothetical protein H8D96_11745 [Desulfobacterales bacterium]|uniref:PAS domain-containing protein n=1 Tax=Candidatus Desulfatibia vada TaxID=2841696 RepID=A0A8J6TTJ5_9BACT|nr:hypothetical protein [Candidatus Desulfatibia vada]
MAIGNSAGGIIYINPDHERLFGQSLEEAQELNLS